MKFKTFVSLAILPFLLAGCGKKEEQETKKTAPQKQVSIYKTTLEPFVSPLEVFGTLEPEQETTIAAQVSGTVNTLFVREGDHVAEGQKLLEFSATDNRIQLDSRNALEIYENAKNTLELTKKSAEKDEANARIAVAQAELNLKNASATNTKTGISLESQIESSKKSIEVGKVNLDIAETNLKNVRENNEKKRKNFSQDIENTLHNANVVFQNAVVFVDETIGVSFENKLKNNYGNYLSFYDQSALVTLRNEWRVGNSSLEQLTKEITNFSQEGGGNMEALTSLLKKSEEFGSNLRKILQLFDTVLNKSEVSGNLTESILLSLKSQNGSYKNSLEAQIASITKMEQTISDFLIQAPQSVTNAELSLLSSKNQLAQAEQNLLQLQASVDVQKTGTLSSKENAVKSLETAKNTLQNTREKSALQIQSAETQLDNARNQLSQSQLQMEKLTVISPLAGVITLKNVESGNTVSAGAPLFTIAKIDRLILRGNIPASQMLAVQKMKKAVLKIEGFETREATLRRVFPTADKNTRQILIELQMENSDEKIPANVFATASLQLSDEKESLKIPFSSLISQDPAKVFLVVQEDKKNIIHSQVVHLGRKEGEYVEITKGLQAGDTVVSQKVIGLSDGDEVSFAEEKKKQPLPQKEKSLQTDTKEK